MSKKPITSIEIEVITNYPNTYIHCITVWRGLGMGERDVRFYMDPSPSSMVRAFLAIMNLGKLVLDKRENSQEPRYQ